MTHEEESAWWQETHARLDQALAHLLQHVPDALPSRINVLALEAYCLLQRDHPRILCAHCGRGVQDPDEHVCEGGGNQGG